MTKLTILAVAAMALGGVLAGCGDTATDNQTTEPTTKIEGDGATPVVFANEKGEALCPVMGGAIADTTGLKYEDYEGKRYYFCCDECPDQFHADPAKFADGKAMPETPKM
jgi:YHS domain-containing protein